MPNKYTIKMHQKAYRDLDRIYQYIYEQMPEYAEREADRLEAGISDVDTGLRVTYNKGITS